MARPLTLPTWATNANYAGGPNAGTPTKVTPAGGRIADGWRNNDVPPAQEQNWWQDLINQWTSWFDSGYTNFAALPNLAGVPDGSWIRVRGFSGGWYVRIVAGTGLAADGQYVVDSAVEAGQWVSERWLEVKAKMHPSIGPVPGESFSVATAVGRINPDLVPYGHLTHQIEIGTQYTTASTTTLSNAAGAAMATWTLGTLAANDIVRVTIPAVAFVSSANGFEVAMYISFDNGVTYTLMSPASAGGGVPYVYDQTGTTNATNVDLSFVKIASAGICKVQLRGCAVSAGTLHVTTGAGMIEARRP